MFYLLLKVSFAYLLPVSLKSLCFSVLSTKKNNFVQCYSVLSDFHLRPMMIMSRDLVSSVPYCSIYINLFPLKKLLKIAVTSLT